MLGFDQILWSLSAVAIMTAFTSLVALCVWWLVRRKLIRLSLPTLKLFDNTIHPLPKLEWRLPPLLAFLCFALLVGCLGLLSLKPETVSYTQDEKATARLHLLVDMSPSMQASVDLTLLKKEVIKIGRQLLNLSELSVSSTGAPEAVAISRDEELKQFAESLSWHRPGVRLGKFLKEFAGGWGEVRKIIVISDGDLHSWSDVNWRGVQGEQEILFYRAGRLARVSDENIFINNINLLNSYGVGHTEVDVEIFRRGKIDRPAQATLVSVKDEKTVEKVDVSFPASKDKVTVRMGFKKEVLSTGSGNDVISFEIEPTNEDSISEDNLFYFNPNFQDRNAVMIAAPMGERSLEDPTFHLQKTLQVLDYKVDRIDRVEQPGPKPGNYGLWMLAGGIRQGIDSFCPKSLSLNSAVKSDSKTKVWIFPESPGADFSELCWCYARIMSLVSVDDQKMPSYCGELNTREQYIGVLTSLGSKQVGGSLGDAESAVAFRSVNQNSGLDVLAFTVALSPYAGTNIGFAKLPSLVRGLISFQGEGGLGENLLDTAMLRVADISEMKSLIGANDVRIYVNVPLQESALNYLPSSQLPTPWGIGESEERQKQLIARQQHDAKPFIQLILLGVLSVLCVEALGGIFILFFKRWKHVFSVVLCGFIIQFLMSNHARAQVQLNLLGYQMGLRSAAQIAEEVEARTSITFNPQVKNFGSFDRTSEEQAWLWVHDLKNISDAKGVMTPKIQNWIRRGGFLIVEQLNLKSDRLEAFAKNIFGTGGDANRLAWQVIPPDHELMRSFHLLDALPSCQGSVWRGLQYDGRLAALTIPYNFLEVLLDPTKRPQCMLNGDQEQRIRSFINILMVVLATDYKRDQIHLPEILKRLR